MPMLFYFYLGSFSYVHVLFLCGECFLHTLCYVSNEGSVVRSLLSIHFISHQAWSQSFVRGHTQRRTWLNLLPFITSLHAAPYIPATLSGTTALSVLMKVSDDNCWGSLQVTVLSGDGWMSLVLLCQVWKGGEKDVWVSLGVARELFCRWTWFRGCSEWRKWWRSLFVSCYEQEYDGLSISLHSQTKGLYQGKNASY